MIGPRAAAAVLAVLGLGVTLATLAYPPGSQGVPGPALVPRLLGIALVVVASLIVRSPGSGGPPIIRNRRAVSATMALLVAYGLLWRVVPYGVLTGLLLLVFLRLTGVLWRGVSIAAVAMAGTLQFLFQRGLGVRF
jgi:hypothetical protein